jgi:hypothetical protein
MKAKLHRNSCGSAKSILRSRSSLLLQNIQKSGVKDQPDEIQGHDTQHCQTSYLKKYGGTDRIGKSRNPWLEKLFFTMWLFETGVFQDGLVRCRQVLSMVPAAQSKAKQASGTGRVENSEQERLGGTRCP